MDFDEIKNLKPQNGERYIIVENGKPVLVLMNFEDYKKRLSAEKEKEVDQEKTLPLIPQKTEKIKGELTLEDLPF